MRKSNKFAEANAALAEILELSNTRYIPPYHFTLPYHGLNRRDEAYANLESAFEQRDPKMTFLNVEPKWNDLRSEPRFVDLMRRLNFE